MGELILFSLWMANRAVCSDLARIQVSKSVYQFPHSVNSLVTILSTIQCYFSHKYTKGKFSSPPLGAWALLKPGTHKAICRSICHFEANCMTNHPYRIVCILKFCSCSTFVFQYFLGSNCSLLFYLILRKQVSHSCFQWRKLCFSFSPFF